MSSTSNHEGINEERCGCSHGRHRWASDQYAAKDRPDQHASVSGIDGPRFLGFLLGDACPTRPTSRAEAELPRDRFSGPGPSLHAAAPVDRAMAAGTGQEQWPTYGSVNVSALARTPLWTARMSAVKDACGGELKTWA